MSELNDVCAECGKIFGAFWDYDRNKAVYGELLRDDGPDDRYRYVTIEGSEYYMNFEPCARPVPWPPEPLPKKMIAYIKDDAKFQAWAWLISDKGPTKALREMGIEWREEGGKE